MVKEAVDGEEASKEDCRSLRVEPGGEADLPRICADVFGLSPLLFLAFISSLIVATFSMPITLKKLVDQGPERR